MARIEIDVSDDVLEWAKMVAEKNRLSIGEYVEALLLLESCLRKDMPDGRTLRTRAAIYRGEGHYFTDDIISAVREES